MSAIPQKSRQLVRDRTHGQCDRCGASGSEWHHRRRRRVRGHFEHCPCNGAWLCATDHRWVHANPAAAREAGFIVSAHEEEPSSVPVKSFLGWAHFTCSGEVTLLERGPDGA